MRAHVLLSRAVVWRVGVSGGFYGFSFVLVALVVTTHIQR